MGTGVDSIYTIEKVTEQMISLKLRLIREHNRIYRHILKWLWCIQGKDAPRVYMFHSVVDDPKDVYSEFAITKESFEKFIHYELTRGQKPMDAETLKRAVDNPDAFKNHFAVTFDDIYDSVYQKAYPVLKKLKIPFVVFIAPAIIGREDSAAHVPMITIEHLKEMATDPLCIIASHGIVHGHYRSFTKGQTMQNLTESQAWLERTYGKKVEFFAFPFGRRVDVSSANIRVLSKCGYYCGFSALDGSLKQKWFSTRWFLPRILVSEDYIKNETKN